jgi:hypothetical protein
MGKIARALTRAAVLMTAAMLHTRGHAQVSVNSDGHASYRIAVPVPPGINGMAPDLAVALTGDNGNSVLGVGWGLVAGSVLQRCASILDTDGVTAPVSNTTNDKLCLDGQRLIQTDASGNPATIPQAGDAAGQAAGSDLEFRTESNPFARIRTYGYADGSTAASGPAWVRVWAKDGKIYDYGASPSADANSQSLILGKAPGGTGSVATSWLLTRISDQFGNVIDFKYEQRNKAWGTGPTAGSPIPGLEWSLLEIQYSSNKVLFSYDDSRPDPSEAYSPGNKSIRMRRLNAITSYTNAPNTSSLGVTSSAVAVRTLQMTYDTGPASGRSRLRSVKVCAGGPSSTSCLPPTTFGYADGGAPSYTANANFASGSLATLPLFSAANTRGVLLGDFNGDGRTDLLVWDNDPTKNALYISDGHGGFAQASTFNVNTAGDGLFNSNGCYVSEVVDINGDGLPDIFRYGAATDINGKTCSSPGPTQVYLNKGDGTFNVQPVTLPTGYGLARRYSAPNAPGDGSKVGWFAGNTFYVLDVDGDGLPDIVTTYRPYQVPTYPEPTPPTNACDTMVCTHLFKGDGNGGFTTNETSLSNLQNMDIYTDPDFSYTVAGAWRVSDVNKDGLDDIALDGHVLRSLGNWNYKVDPTLTSCFTSFDFNGDGLDDCLSIPYLSASTGAGSALAANFNLTQAQLSSAGQDKGILYADFDGDGRGDLLVAASNPSNNALYLSNGDGTFRPDTAFGLTTSNDQLVDDAGKTQTVLGDFTGSGTVEMLRIVDSPAAGTAAVNRLYVRTDPTPMDQLRTVTTPSGSTTTIIYTMAASNDGRYVSDRGTPFQANRATDRRIDIVPARPLVKTLVVDTGVGSATLSTEYAYFGAKASTVGRGLLGMREMRVQTIAPDGTTPVTTSIQRSQDFPYLGRTTSTNVYLSTLFATSASAPISSASSLYCDARSSADPDAAISAGQSCPRDANTLFQPYELYTTVSGQDIDGNRTPLPTTSTKYAVNTSGLVTEVDKTTTATIAGSAKTYSSTSTFAPQPDVTACSSTTQCSWILGLASSAAVTHTVPALLLPTQAGTATNATATHGTALTATLTAPAFTPTEQALSSTASAVLTNTSDEVLTLAPVPSASSVTGADFSFVSTTCGTNLAVGASCSITVRFSPATAGTRSGQLTVQLNIGAKSVALSGQGLTQAALSLSNCSASASTTPTPATLTCILGNAGQSAAGSITYGTSLASPASAAGPSSCAANTANCGTVIVHSPTAAGTYAGTVTATPNLGGAGSATFAALTVYTQAQPTLSACASTTTTTPAPATFSCTLGNSGQTAAGSMSYASTLVGSTVIGPSGSCAANATNCGTVTLTTPAAAGSYSGTLTATAAGGTRGNATFSGVTVLTQAALTISGCTSRSYTTPTPAVLTCTLGNAGQSAAASITYATSLGSPASAAGPASCAASTANCGTVTVYSPTAAGNYSGTVTATPATGSAGSASFSGLIVYTQGQPTLSACASTTTTTPTAATFSCTLGNAGQTAISTLSYSSTLSGSSVSGPTGCAANASNCGAVTVVTPTAAGSYSGTLIATASNGQQTSQPFAGVTVLTQPALALAACSSSPSTSPVGATFHCTVINNGQSTATGIAYGSTLSGASVSGPTGSCAGGGATCGTATLTTPGGVGSYSGNLVATPSSGSGASQSFSSLNVMAPVAFTVAAPVQGSSVGADWVFSWTYTNPNLIATTVTAIKGLSTSTIDGPDGVGGTCRVGTAVPAQSTCTVTLQAPQDCKLYRIYPELDTAQGAVLGAQATISGNTALCR